MHRESIFVCTYVVDDEELEAHVPAWDAREAAELFARELELELESDVQPDAVRVRLVLRGADPHREIAA